VDTFRVGCLGVIGAAEIRRAVDAIGAVIREMGISRLS